MRYLSVCSGIEAATVAWHPLGWEAAAFSEIEAFPRAVLQHHYPEVPLHGDFTTIGADDYGAIDLLVGGTPCQSFSIAGLRGGLDDDRGNLALEFLLLADRKRPRWLVWENVPGVLSIDGGRAFGSILGGMGELGYGFAYRVLDAQHFGVPQRRRRVFVVGYFGDWRRAAAVLFERHSLSGHSAPRREAREVAPVCPTLRAGGNRTGGDRPPGTDVDTADSLIVAHALRGEGFDASEDGTGRGTPLVPVSIQAGALRENPDSGPDGVGVRTDGQAFTLEARAEVQAVAFVQNSRDEVRQFGGDGQTVGALAAEAGMKQQCYIAFSAKDYGADALEDCSPTLRAGGFNGSHQNGGVMPAVAFPINPNALRGDSCAITPSADAAGKVRLRDPGLGVGADGDPADTLQAGGPGAVGTAAAVRRLTPRECERLQGFPDDYTLIPVRGKPAADGPRYKALGNSMAVPVMRWIGERIAAVEDLAERKAA